MDYVEDNQTPARYSSIDGDDDEVNPEINQEEYERGLIEEEHLKSLGIPSGPIKYGSIYGEAKEFSVTNPLSSLRQKLRSNGSISSSQLSPYCTRRNMAYIIIAVFCLFSFLGIMELNSPNYMQSLVNPSGEAKIDSSGIEAAPAGNMKNTLDGALPQPTKEDIPQQQDEVLEDTSAPTEEKDQIVEEAEVEGGEAMIKDFGQFSLQQFYGNYGYPQQHCVTFSNMNMDASGTDVKNKRICLQEGWLGTETAAVMIDKTLMEETGLFDTETGKEDGMKYIATGPGLWLVMTIANVKQPYIVKPASNINLADHKNDVEGLVTSIKIRTGMKIIEPVVGKINKKTLNRNCFVVYGSDPWSKPDANGLMFCAKWVTGDPSTINFSETDITSAGYSLATLDGGVSFILVGGGVGKLHVFPEADCTGDSLEVKRSSVYNFETNHKREDLDKRIKSFSLVFGGTKRNRLRH